MGARDAKSETTMEIASILARVMNEKIAETKDSFLTLGQDI